MEDFSKRAHYKQVCIYRPCQKRPTNGAEYRMGSVLSEAKNDNQDLPPKTSYRASYLQAVMSQDADCGTRVNPKVQNSKAKMTSPAESPPHQGKATLEPLKDSIGKAPSLAPSPSCEKQIFSMDCEMVAVNYPGSTKNVHKAAYVCVVDVKGTVAYRSYIAQKYPIANCFTWISGITHQVLQGAPSLKRVQNDLYRLFMDNILVGHALQGDLKSLEMQHPVADQRDTQKYLKRNLPYGETRTNLKLMASTHLGRKIQHCNAAHDPVEDATAAMDLYLLYKDQMDALAQDPPQEPHDLC